MRFYVPLLVMSLLCAHSIAQQSTDSLFEPLPDTLEAYVDQNMEVYIYHRTGDGEDLGSLAMKYSVPPKDILEATKFLGSQGDTTDPAFLIPISVANISPRDFYHGQYIPVTYTVRPKETVFRIARRYFDIKADELRQLNKLESNDLSIGQRLLVGWYRPPEPVQPTLLPDSLSVEPYVDPFYPEIPESSVGLAFWDRSNNDAEHMFALHRTARLHSMIEITNPMLDTRVLVKVIGRIPPTYTRDISLVVSPAVANKLGILDPRFRAEMRYLR